MASIDALNNVCVWNLTIYPVQLEISSATGRFDANAELPQQAARALRGPEVVAPTERPGHSPSDVRMQNL